MKRYRNLLIIENEKDLNPENLIWKEDMETRLRCGVIHHKGNKDFPQYYKRVESFDAHYCDDYYPIDKKEAKIKIEEYIDELQEAIFRLNQMID